MVFADAEKCFDKLWLEDCIADTVGKGVREREAALIYKMNENARIKVMTPCGETKEIQKKKIVKPVEVSTNLEDLDLGDDGGLEDVEESDADLGEALQDAGAAPVIALVNKILVKALQEEVSDIHVEPQEEYLRVRFRKDGVLRQAFPHLPKKIIPAVTARFKIISELDIAERRMPQDGRIRRVFQDRKVDFRVSTLPSRYGEKVVLRILDNSSTQLGLGALITDEETLHIVQDMAKRPFNLAHQTNG